MTRHIACFEVPSLGIALARLRDSSLKHRPVALAPLGTPRACLQEVSEEAHDQGLLPGLPVDEARRLCPAIRLLPPDLPALRTADQAIWQIVARFAPVWEPFLPGHLFLDLTGTRRLFGPATDTVSTIERAVAAQSGLHGFVGLGTNKLVARVASGLVPPDRIYVVQPGAERPFLAPLPIARLPGIRPLRDRVVLRLLDDLNLQTVGELADTPLRDLELILGRQGAVLHQWAQGIDPTPVRAPAQQPRIEAALTLDPDEIDDDGLRRRLFGLLEGVCRTLRRQQRLCRGLTLELRYSDDRTVSRTIPVPCPSCWESELFPSLEALHQRVFARRVRLRAMTIGLERLVPAVHQLLLFPEDSPASRQRERARHLAMALDRVRARHGDQAIRRGSA